MEDEEKMEFDSDINKIKALFNAAPKNRRYYFEQIENGQISEGYTNITITNHIAEITSDDPDAHWLARKRGGSWSFKFEERFQPPPLKTETPPPNMNILEMLEWLSQTDIGEAQAQIIITLRLDDLAPVIRGLLRYLPFSTSEGDYKPGGPITFTLRCRKWGNLGWLELAKRGDITYLILSSIPQPTGDELSAAKMLGDFALFKYGKQKYRGKVMRRFFKDLRDDPIWQWIDEDKSSNPTIESRINKHNEARYRLTEHLLSNSPKGQEFRLIWEALDKQQKDEWEKMIKFVLSGENLHNASNEFGISDKTMGRRFKINFGVTSRDIRKLFKP